jgi:hypothetical protein
MCHSRVTGFRLTDRLPQFIKSVKDDQSHREIIVEVSGHGLSPAIALTDAANQPMISLQLSDCSFSFRNPYFF